MLREHAPRVPPFFLTQGGRGQTFYTIFGIEIGIVSEHEISVKERAKSEGGSRMMEECVENPVNEDECRKTDDVLKLKLCITFIIKYITGLDIQPRF